MSVNRGGFDPTGFDPDDDSTWPDSPGGTLLTDNDEPLTTDDDDVLTTDEPWYRPDDYWTVTAGGEFQGLQLEAGGRLIAHAP